MAAAALLTAGCSGGLSDDGKDGAGAGDAKPSAADSSSSTSTTAALPASLTAQKLGWGRCKATGDSAAPSSDWQCATLKVPLDWAKPDGSTIGLALIRSKATGGDRIGSLLF